MIRSISLLSSCVLLSACISVLPEPETADALYRLRPVEASHALAADIIIREPEASRLYAGRAIASEAADGSLRLIPRVEWADAATRMLQIALLDSFAAGTETTGSASASSAGLHGDYELSWRISDFVVAGSTARCQLELTLLDGGTRRVISQKTVRTSSEAGSNGSRDRAMALSDAARSCVSQAADYIAAATGVTSASASANNSSSRN